MDAMTPARFREQSRAACRDANLRAVLDHATRYFIGKRSASLEAFPGRDEHFARARATRLRSLARLPELLEELEANATAAGTVVHWAADAAEARSIIVGIARQAQAKVIVKGKSMVTEEIALNPALEAAGPRSGRRTWASSSCSWRASRPRTSSRPASTSPGRTWPSSSPKSSTCTARASRS
jgi:L-lactate dehydrogenase complex protein LldF